MRGKLLALLAVASFVILSPVPARAVTYGEPDGGEHPYVGLVFFYDAEGAPAHRCSGTLLSPTVFLTAGHCTFETASAQVWFNERVEAPPYPFKGGVKGTPYTHPAYDELAEGDFATFPNTSDVGVVVLDKPVRLGRYGALPALGELDALATERGRQEVVFEVVGYGLQGVKPDRLALRDRYKALSQLINLRSALTDGYNLQITGNPGVGGGICFGDSGGPVFRDDASNVVAGVASWAFNQNCKGAGVAYRVDIANAQDFIVPFLA